eukprot:TRINITY_DN1905_c0_g1_i1.p1 TRINITY_DN1905_c0_g1~~TRINITY_DN1905_c0_g1_i1.p1  ORF type:complete len:301 (-),score=58.35 TRINITY_DN1905_c0_g1_i1:178-1080(-)
MSQQSLFTTLHNNLIGVIGSMTPVPTTSSFLQGGMLTPEEFVAAGDLLVYKCPTWSWAGGQHKVDILPPDKQYLITRNVPCKTRFRDDGTEKKGEIVEDDWLSVAYSSAMVAEDDIPEIETDAEKKTKSPQKTQTTTTTTTTTTQEVNSDDEDVPDMETFEDDNILIQDDPATVAVSVSNIQKTRTYDISITYERYFRTPKIWLFGYSENQQPLTAQEIFMDISGDHAGKTVTLEPHPHIGIPFAYIHPCKHASVMKKFIARMQEKGKTPRVEFYLLLFLKLMNAVIPTIAYDNTFDYGL